MSSERVGDHQKNMIRQLRTQLRFVGRNLKGISQPCCSLLRCICGISRNLDRVRVGILLRERNKERYKGIAKMYKHMCILMGHEICTGKDREKKSMREIC